MIKQAILNQAIIGIVQDINEKYIREAERIWDLGEAECPVFSMWIKIYDNRMWFEMVQSN